MGSSWRLRPITRANSLYAGISKREAAVLSLHFLLIKRIFSTFRKVTLKLINQLVQPRPVSPILRKADRIGSLKVDDTIG